MAQEAAPCIFCVLDSVSNEHAWPAWLRRYLIPIAAGSNRAERERLDEEADFTVDCVCDNCNRGWMHKLEVNVSPIELALPGYAEKAHQTILYAGAYPSSITIEVTESAAAAGVAQLAETARQLRALGIRVSIDDFGTEQSSLWRLSEMNLDELKLDQAFLRTVPGNPRAELIVWTILRLADKLGVDVVAEGVENAAQLLFLLASGCQRAQGYHLGRPLPPDAATTLLQRQRATTGPAWARKAT